MLLRRMAEILSPLQILELRGGGRGLMATVRKPKEPGVVVPAQTGSPERDFPVLLFDDPAGTVEEFLGGPVGTVQDRVLVNIVTTEFRERRLILADGLGAWERSGAEVRAVLVPEQRVEACLEALPRRFEAPEGFERERFLERMRRYCFVEHLPGRLVPERIAYLLANGNEQGPAMVVTVHGDAYVLKARLEVC